MKINTRNLGTNALKFSMILIVLGTIFKSNACLIIGGFTFSTIVIIIGAMMKAGLKQAKEESEAKNYSAIKETDIKIELIRKAYEDGRVSDEDISQLMRSLYSNATSTTSVAKPIVNQHVATIAPAVNTTENESIDNDTVVVTSEINNDDDVIEDNNDSSYINLNGSYPLQDIEGPKAKIIVDDIEIDLNMRDFNRDMNDIKHKDCSNLLAWQKININDIECYLYLDFVNKVIELRHD